MLGIIIDTSLAIIRSQRQRRADTDRDAKLA